MRKLTLGLEALQVESFDTGAGGGERGTVVAHDDSGYTCGGDTCMGGQQTCWDSCDTVCNTWFCA